MVRLHRLLAALHARGFHAAVIAGLVMMPTVIAVGFWTDGGEHGGKAAPGTSNSLRGTLEGATGPTAERPAP